jgi:acyl-CoA synthetase (AMP-forming)/AMP-acid ligase II
LSVLSGETNLMKLNMGDALLRNAQRFPNKVALDDGRVTRTYLDLQSRTNSLGNYFLQQGICPGDRIALSCGNRAEHLEVIFALAKIGVTAVPFDYHWSCQEWEAMLNFFQPKAFVLEKRNETADTADLVLDRLKSKRVLFIGGAFTPQATPYEEAISTATPENNGIDVDGNQPFIIMITSGTTGFPKGCIINHETMRSALSTMLLARG